MNPAIRATVVGLIKELVPSLMAEFVSFNAIKNLLTKGRMATDKVAGDDENIKVKGGGTFNLTDEAAFLGVVGRVNADKRAEVVQKMSAVLAEFEHDWQRKRFRVIVAMLGEVDVTDVIDKQNDIRTDLKTKATTDKSTQKEKKTNVGIIFLESFAALTKEQAMEVVKAAGVLEPEPIRSAYDWLVKNETTVIETLEEFHNTLSGKPLCKPEKTVYRGFFREVVSIIPIPKFR